MKKKCYTIFCAALFAEVAFLFFACSLCIYCLFKKSIISNIDTLAIMVKLTLIIAIIAIPLESILLRLYLSKRKDAATDGRIPEISEKEKIQRYLHIMETVFLILWFVHGIVFSFVVEWQMGLRRSEDMYMFLGRPGNITIFSSSIGVLASRLILEGTDTKVKK